MRNAGAVLASQPAVALGLLLVTWLAGFVVGFGLLLWLPGAAARKLASGLDANCPPTAEKRPN